MAGAASQERDYFNIQDPFKYHRKGLGCARLGVRVLDPQFLGSGKLVSGPSLAVESTKTPSSLSRPLTRIASPDGSAPLPNEEHLLLDSSKASTVSTQVNHALSEIFTSFDRTRLFSCIRPDDSNSPNSFDKRHVKTQIKSLLVPKLVARRGVEFIIHFQQSVFCQWYVPTMQGWNGERIRQCATSNGWKERTDYVLGHRSIWLSYSAWKTVKDRVRVAEKEQRRLAPEAIDDDESATEYTYTDTHGHDDLDNESRDNLLIAGVASCGSRYQDPCHLTSVGCPRRTFVRRPTAMQRVAGDRNGTRKGAHVAPRLTSLRKGLWP